MRPRRHPRVCERRDPSGELLLERGSRRFRLSAAGERIWRVLDGRRALAELPAAARAEPTELLVLLERLHQAGFLREGPKRPRPGLLDRGLLAIERPLRWEGVGPLLERVHRAAPWLSSPRVGGLLALLGLLGLPAAWASTPERLEPELLLVLAPLALLELALHELGHGLATQRAGCRVAALGLRWHGVAPMVFLDTSEAWRLDRSQRLGISLAGPLVNLGLFGLAALLALLLPAPAATLAWSFAMANLLTAALNLDPFLELDGYYLLSDAMGRPGLRPRALEWLVGGRAVSGPERVYGLGLALHTLLLPALGVWAWRGLVGPGWLPLLAGGLSLGWLSLDLRSAREPALARERRAG